MNATELTETRVIAPGAGESLRVMGDLITFKLLARDTGGAFTMFEGLVRPGAMEPVHFHPAEDETFYVLEGVLTFLVGEAWREAPAGTVVYVPRGVVHGFRNEAATPARVLCIDVPGGLHEGLFAALSELQPPASPEEGASLIALARRHGTEILPPPAA